MISVYDIYNMFVIKKNTVLAIARIKREKTKANEANQATYR